MTPGPLAEARDRVVLIAADGHRFSLSLQPGQTFHSHLGIIAHNDLIGQPLGRRVLTQLEQPFIVLRPSLYDTIMNVKRVSQIIYPKEIGLIMLKLDIGSGSRVIEAGSGSGALTIALAHGVAPAGRVYSYELRDDMIKATQRNLDHAGLSEWVDLCQRDIAEGFDQTEVDALFLDVREPTDYLAQAEAALVDGGFFGALVPTTNQVSDLLAALAERPSFINLEVLEIFMRHYKPVPQRLRPSDTMIGHTGFMLFGRKIAAGEAGDGGFTNTMSRKRS